MERVLFQDCPSIKRHDEMSRDLSDMYITRQSNPNGEDMIHKNIDINLLQECNNIERGPPLSQEKKIHEDPAVKHRNPAVKHKDPVVKGLSKYLRFVARKDDCMTNTGQIFNILSKQEADDVALQRNCSEGTKSGNRTAECSNSSDTESAKDSSSTTTTTSSSTTRINSDSSNSSFSGAGSSDQAEDDDGDGERGNGRKGMEQRKGKCKKQRQALRSKLKSKLRLKIMAGLRSRFLSVVRRKFWRVIPKTFCNKIVDGPSKKKKGGHFVGVRGSPQTVRRKNSLKPPASHGQASQRKVRRKSSFQDPFSSSKFPQDQLSKFKNGPWTSNALRVRSHVLVAGASYLVQLLRQRSANEDWGKRRNPPRGRTKRDCWQYERQKSLQAIDGETPSQCTDRTQGEFCGTPSDFYILDIGDTAALVTPHPKSAAPPPRLKLRRGYSVHQQCDEDLGLQGQADHGLRPTSSHAGTENIEDDVNDVQLHEERADNRLLHILIVVIIGIILYTPLWSPYFTDNMD
ncbi:uncharacterized protein LOC112565802 [Pomacea canaliculata]|uniref:uncharacterized protein LOC112565802 n=1 Tax=Pomacea canaliculata TaxID=400727 RepID=UPI000D734ACB|nr:uncharacterized protein LOC112565802 [Pomacea canaliculata]XP_025097382.1 uncharacterized protein LOC112565802 [Pomacea canaliculata]